MNLMNINMRNACNFHLLSLFIARNCATKKWHDSFLHTTKPSFRFTNSLIFPRLMVVFCAIVTTSTLSVEVEVVAAS